ncbi:MAG: class I SAM-dependent methyltransferase [Spirochaetaceae bacterium]|nr:class I SAM-dependent methyltransferase [Spirochaetaceae bacterium]
MKNETVEFDQFTDGYNETVVKDLGKLGKYRDTAFVYKADFLKHILKKEPKTILDFGCGIGSFIPYLRASFKDAKLYGCDVSPQSIETAKKNYSYCDFAVVENVDDLKIYEKTDCIIVNTVLHHIPQREHEYWVNGLHGLLADSESGGGGGL